MSREHLVFKALVALAGIINRCREEPVTPTSELRFILAWLYAIGESTDRQVFDDFWNVIQKSNEDGYSTSQARYMRRTMAHTHLMGIARNTGVELTVDIEHQIADALMGPERRR